MPDKFSIGDKVVLDRDKIVVVKDIVLEESAEGVKYKIKADADTDLVVNEDRLTFYLED